jgi:hypothetical protein
VVVVLSDVQREFAGVYSRAFVGELERLVVAEPRLSFRNVYGVCYVFVDLDVEGATKGEFVISSGFSQVEDADCKDWLSHLRVSYEALVLEDGWYGVAGSTELLWSGFVAVQAPEVFAALAVATVLNHVRRDFQPPRVETW